MMMKTQIMRRGFSLIKVNELLEQVVYFEQDEMMQTDEIIV